VCWVRQKEEINENELYALTSLIGYFVYLIARAYSVSTARGPKHSGATQL